LNPASALDVLVAVAPLIERDPETMEIVLQKIQSRFTVFHSATFAGLEFPVFGRVCHRIYFSGLDEGLADALCGAIESYVKSNLLRIGSHEFGEIAKTFPMRIAHDGILTLYKIALDYGWDCSLCEKRIIHWWRSLDRDRLSRLPVLALGRLLHENYLNTRSEDDIFDFIELVLQNQPSCSVGPLLNYVRIASLSPEYLEKFRSSPIVPQVLKTHEIDIYSPRRLPRSEVRCLLLGACDLKALGDVKRSLVYGGLTEEYLVAVRADQPYQIDFSTFHVILLFGFYKFWQRSGVSRSLYAFHNNGGGLVLAYGAHRSGPLGIGEPLASAIPIEIGSGSEFHDPPVDVEGEQLGCKNMRVICQARDDGMVITTWNDGIPLVIQRQHNKEEGGISVFNAIPVSNEIIRDQWSPSNKTMIRPLVSAIISVASEVRSRRVSVAPKQDPSE
jgi:hypothetical protein